MGRYAVDVLVEHQSINVPVVIQKLVIIGCLTRLLMIGSIECIHREDILAQNGLG